MNRDGRTCDVSGGDAGRASVSAAALVSCSSPAPFSSSVDSSTKALRDSSSSVFSSSYSVPSNK